MSLTIINGPCGIGKSTAAKHLHERVPLSYLVDVDVIMRNISHYRDYREEKWELREAVAFATVDTVLGLGRDAVVEKMIFDTDILDRYHEIGKRHGANITEIILWAPKEFVMQRADARGWREVSSLTPETCERFWYEIEMVKPKRPNAHVIDVTQMSEEEVVNAIEAYVKGTN